MIHKLRGRSTVLVLMNQVFRDPSNWANLSFPVCYFRPTPSQKPARELKVEDALLYLDQVSGGYKVADPTLANPPTQLPPMLTIVFIIPLVYFPSIFSGQNGVFRQTANLQRIPRHHEEFQGPIVSVPTIHRAVILSEVIPIVLATRALVLPRHP
jgi:hypothetical protein